MKITDEAVEAAAEAIKNGRPFRHAETARAALEAALPHLSQGAGEKEGEPPTDAEAKARLAEIIAKNPEDFGPGTNPLGDTSAALPHMGGVKAAIQNSVLYQCTICADIYPEGSCHPSDSVWVLGDKVLCENCLGEESEGESAIRVDKIVASHEPAPTDTQEVVSEAGAEKRDIWECANQLLGYIDQSTPEDLANFLRREGHAAADLAQSITDAQSALTACQQEVERLTQENALSLDRRRQLQARISRLQTSAETAEARNAELVKALDQLLDDMGENGLCVCQAAKDQAIAALGGQSNEA